MSYTLWNMSGIYLKNEYKSCDAMCQLQAILVDNNSPKVCSILYPQMNGNL